MKRLSFNSKESRRDQQKTISGLATREELSRELSAMMAQAIRRTPMLALVWLTITDDSGCALSDPSKEAFLYSCAERITGV